MGISHGDESDIFVYIYGYFKNLINMWYLEPYDIYVRENKENFMHIFNLFYRRR